MSILAHSLRVPSTMVEKVWLTVLRHSPLWKRRCGSQFEGTVLYGGEGVAHSSRVQSFVVEKVWHQEIEKLIMLYFQLKKTDDGMLFCLAFLLTLYSVKDPKNGTVHIQGGSFQIS